MKLVDAFYKKAMSDDLIGHFFTEVVPLDLEKHMPTMYDFWESTLMHTGVYKGNPMLKHIDLHRKAALKEEHFERWLALWTETLGENFQGPNAEKAFQRANQIALLMQHKIHQG